jgi:hypothetical protein
MTFQQGESGNPAGRPRGARNKRTIAAENMFDRDGADIIDRLIRLAKGGDVAAIRMCIDRICPRQRDRPVSLDLPPMTRPADAVAAMGAIVQAIGDGDIGPQEAAGLAKVVASFSQTIATAELEQRLDKAERDIELLNRE